MIDIAEILKDCQGTKLYSPLCGDCTLLRIYDNLGFDVVNETGNVFNFSYDGKYDLNGECCIFPSKENRDWSKFKRQFENGDIIYVESKSYSPGLISIYKEENILLFYDYCAVSLDGKHFYLDSIYGLIQKADIAISRLATPEEEQILFDAIKRNGYKWYAETKTLKKLIAPKFKSGDVITKNDNLNDSSSVLSFTDDYYYIISKKGLISKLKIKEQDNWKLVDSNLKKFDISTLKPFGKVLVRQNNYEKWKIDLFGFYNSKKYHTTGDSAFKQCIPYESNESLLGTTDNCDEFYKTW